MTDAKAMALGKRVTIPDVLPRLVAYLRRPGNFGSGGSLHVYTDGNDDRESLAYCEQSARENGDAEGEALARIIGGMSWTQRRKLARRAGDAAWEAGPMAPVGIDEPVSAGVWERAAERAGRADLALPFVVTEARPCEWLRRAVEDGAGGGRG